MAEEKKSNLPRLLSLFVAFLGCVVTVLPIVFGVGGGNAVLFILIGSGVTVVALGVFLFFSI